ncbi:MAG: isocitrate lyase/phosphoenolpyruvate mutase family protein [Candidatus Eremiobacteraeota bacterium]|nr:isocitrate lyase/phosphoenolpyruvate mutase family protein [Candidatus Eremiobacteraeota bacterium]
MNSEKAERFRALHREGCFIIANAWDAGSARILTGLGFAALATTSAGLAFMLGRRDGEAAVSRSEALDNARQIVASTDLPVSADLENGYGAAPDDCATTVRASAEVELCGCTIEDTTADAAQPIHEFDNAVARVAAAAQAARALPTPFVLTARAENFLHGRADLDDTIRRLVAFAEAGADCLYAPGLPDMVAIGKVIAAVSPKPVNVLIGPRDGPVPLRTLADAGVRRVSIGGAFARVAYGETLRHARTLAAGDLVDALQGVPSHDAINDLMPTR